MKILFFFYLNIFKYFSQNFSWTERMGYFWCTAICKVRFRICGRQYQIQIISISEKVIHDILYFVEDVLYFDVGSLLSGRFARKETAKVSV